MYSRSGEGISEECLPMTLPLHLQPPSPPFIRVHQYIQCTTWTCTCMHVYSTCTWPDGMLLLWDIQYMYSMCVCVYIVHVCACTL